MWHIKLWPGHPWLVGVWFVIVCKVRGTFSGHLSVFPVHTCIAAAAELHRVIQYIHTTHTVELVTEAE